MKQYLALLESTKVKVLVAVVLVFAAWPAWTAAAADTAEATCREYDSATLENLKKFRHDTAQIGEVVSVMASYGEQCSFDKSYEFCATELKVKLCVDLVQLRKEQE
jgi:hypothetical protein